MIPDMFTRDRARGPALSVSDARTCRAPRLSDLLLLLASLYVPLTALAQTAGPSRLPGRLETLPPSAVRGEAVEAWLYAIDRGESDGSGTLFRLGASASGGFVDVQVVGETGVQDLFDIAFMGNRLFGIGPGGATFGTSDDVLVEIDPNTAAATPIGTIEVSGFFNALVGESPSTLLAATDGGQLWRIDLAALTASRLGSFGSGLSSSGDLAFVGGTLYASSGVFGSGELVVVNPTSGRATVVGSLGIRDVFGLAADPRTGGLLGVADAASDPRLVTIHRGTGRATVLGRIPATDEITGLATAPFTPAAACNAGGDAVLLENGRFRVDVCWRTADGASGTGKLAQRQGIGATLWFFDPSNPELFLKILDACVPPFDRYWVFVAGLTNVEVTVKVTDLARGFSNTYHNPQGTTMASVADTGSFATCP